MLHYTRVQRLTGEFVDWMIETPENPVKDCIYVFSAVKIVRLTKHGIPSEKVVYKTWELDCSVHENCWVPIFDMIVEANKLFSEDPEYPADKVWSARVSGVLPKEGLLADLRNQYRLYLDDADALGSNPTIMEVVQGDNWIGIKRPNQEVPENLTVTTIFKGDYSECDMFLDDISGLTKLRKINFEKLK